MWAGVGAWFVHLQLCDLEEVISPLCTSCCRLKQGSL